MSAHLPPIIDIADMSVDDVDSGLPRLTLRHNGGEPIVVALAPAAVTGLVDALAGVAGVAQGEARILVRICAEDLIRGLHGSGAAIATGVGQSPARTICRDERRGVQIWATGNVWTEISSLLAVDVGGLKQADIWAQLDEARLGGVTGWIELLATKQDGQVSLSWRKP